MDAKTRATIDDLSKVEGKAELVNGEIVCMSPTGGMPEKASVRIARRLLDYEERAGGGYALPNNVAFAVHLPHRESFSPDASWYVGPPRIGAFPRAPQFLPWKSGARTTTAKAAERAMQDKRADYFACGTQVVWEVDLLGKDVIKSYAASDPENPLIFRRGELAEAEPAVPGWHMPVDDLFA